MLEAMELDAGDVLFFGPMFSEDPDPGLPPDFGPFFISGNEILVQDNSSFTDPTVDSIEFAVVVRDGNADACKPPTTITVTVHLLSENPNSPPVAHDDSATTDEDHAVTVFVVTNDTDVDAGDTPTVTAVNGASAAVGVPILLA